MYNVHDISIIHLIVPGRTGFFRKRSPVLHFDIIWVLVFQVSVSSTSQSNWIKSYKINYVLSLLLSNHWRNIVILVFCPIWPSTLFLQLKQNVSTDCSIYAFYISHCIFTETIKCTKCKNPRIISCHMLF